MKRDWEIVRSVLEEVEALGEQQFQGSQFGYAADTPNDQVLRVRHILLLHEAGFIKGVRADSFGGPALLSPELTWAGHELLDTIRSQTVWTRVKSLAKDKGLELTFDAVKGLGKLALDQIISGVGQG